MFHRVLLLWGAGVSFLWSLAIATTGGFRLRTPWFDLSSRQPLRPLVVALVLATLYVLRYRRYWWVDLQSVAQVRLHPSAIAAACAGAAVVVGIHWGTFVGGGPDASGYVSQADRWVRGELTWPTPEWARGAWWAQAELAAAPIGYRPGPDRTILVPTYSPGLPLMMAIFQRLGGRDAVFLVVPLCGGLAIWAAYLLGRRLAGAWTGATAAVLLLCSGPFLWFVIQPMSDVPAAALWSLALVLAWESGSLSALGAGISAAAAVLVRPNLVPLAIVPAMMLFAVPDRRIKRFASFSTPIMLAALAIAILNFYWYGSPLRSGYGRLSELYASRRIWPNIQQYAQWLFEWQTPLIFLAPFAPLVARAKETDRLRVVLVTVVFPLAVLGLYAAYLTFDHWSFLRFLLPGFPAALAGAATVLTASSRRWRLGPLAVLLVVGLFGFHGWNSAGREGLFLYGTNERRFIRAIDFARGLPENTILVSLAHSGTLNFYAHRDVLRWEALHPPQLDRILADLRRRGHPLYFIGDPFEVDDFKRTFEGAATLDRFTPRWSSDLRGVLLVDLN